MIAAHSACSVRGRFRLTAALLFLCTVASLIAAGNAAAADPQPAGLWVKAPRSVATGHSFTVSGGLTATADLSGETVNVYKVANSYLGETADRLLGTATVTNVGSGNVFSMTVAGLKYGHSLKVTWAGNADYLPGACQAYVNVRPRMVLRARVLGDRRVRLRITLTPKMIVDEQYVPLGGWLMECELRRHGGWRFVGPAFSRDYRTWFAFTAAGTFGPFKPDVYLKPGIRVLRAYSQYLGVYSNRICIRVR